MIVEAINQIELAFLTSKNCFSPNQIDKGTLAMLSCIQFTENQKVLDLGCGYGVVGIYAAKIVGCTNVYMLDVLEEAVMLSKLNAIKNNVNDVTIIKSDGFKELDETNFDIILSNPPYHTDFSVAKMFIEKGFNRLKIGGKMFMVTKRRDWYKNKLISIFGGAVISEIDGYFVFEAEKRQNFYKSKS